MADKLGFRQAEPLASRLHGELASDQVSENPCQSDSAGRGRKKGGDPVRAEISRNKYIDKDEGDAGSVMTGGRVHLFEIVVEIISE